MNVPRVAFLELVLLLAGPTAAAGQTVAAADSLLAAHDTVAAEAAYRAVLARDRNNTEALYHLGLLHFVRIDFASSLSADRHAALEYIHLAARLRPDSAKYLLALADVYRTESDITVRMQVGRTLRRALDAATDPFIRSEIEYRLGRDAFRRYEQLARRWLFVGDGLTVNAAGLMDTWQNLETFLTRQVKPDPGDAGFAEAVETEETLRRALATNPAHVEAAGLLAVFLGERGRQAEAYEIARALTRVAADSGRAWAMLGMTLARLDRWREAGRAFDRALQRMSADQRAPYDHLALILAPDDSTGFHDLGASARENYARRYWGVNQPLFLSQENEIRTEFYTRLTHAMHRWSDPWRGYAGYESDRGRVYVRYGPPDIWANFGRGRMSTGLRADADDGEAADAVATLDNERAVVLWGYTPSRIRFLFAVTPGYERARFTGDLEALYEETRTMVPARFDNLPVVATMDTIAVQMAQFRGATSDTTDVALFSFIPVERMRGGTDLTVLPFETAAIVKDGALADIVRERRTEQLQHQAAPVERRSWRLRLAPAEYLMRVEARIPVIERAARSTALVAVRAFDRDSLQLSDLLLAERAEPTDSAAARWSDFLLVPSSGRFARGLPITLLWENYNLTPDSTGVARYEVALRITVRHIERVGMAARILGGIADAVGITAAGDDRVTLAYERDVAVEPRATVVEHLVIDLDSTQPATYEVIITVFDRVAERTASVRSTFVVTDTPLAR